MNMRRKDREVTDICQIKTILDDCKTCHLAMVDEGQPYVVPLNYAYVIDDNVLTLFFHSAMEGRKIKILRDNSSVCFEMSKEGEPIFAEQTPCNSGYYYASVHGFGHVQFIEDVGEKCSALTLLMKHQANIDVCFTKDQANSVCVFKVTSTDFTGKAKPRSSE